MPGVNSGNNFINHAVEIVTQAIEEDKKGENYEKALELYKRALDYFLLGLKYEKNPSIRQRVAARVDGYMKRAEFLKAAIEESHTSSSDKKKDGGGALTKSKDDKKEDDEKHKLRGSLESAIITEKPNVKWDDVCGLDMAKEALKEAVVLPIKFPQLFTGKRKPWKGILLYGPPGTGKSYLAKAVATEANSTFFAVSSSDLVSKWQGESERLVKQLFEMAREAGHAIVFIDEIDSLCTSRSEGENESSRRIKTEFMVQMDGVKGSQGGVLVLGATNVPWEIDPAMRRRFEKRVYIALPEPPARAKMFKLNLGDTPNDITDEQFQSLGDIAEGYSGSDIAVVVREALMEPLRKCQMARQFIKTSDDLYYPCEDYPNCAYCPIQLSETVFHDTEEKTCKYCGAERMTLYDVPGDRLKVPIVTYADFEKALHRSHSSVAPSELRRFEEWTAEFGQEG